MLADSDGEDSLSPNLDQILAENSKKKMIDTLLEPFNEMWSSHLFMNGNGTSAKPSLTVTDFDYAGVRAADSDDYAGESDEDEPSL